MGQQTSTVTRLEDYDPGHARIAGTDGGTPIETAVTYGQDDYGADVTFYGGTSSNYMLWDESVDTLLLVGTSAKFSLGSFTGATAGTGGAVSASNTAPFKVFADDGGAAIGSGSLVRAGWFRNLQTYTTGNREQESTGVQGSLVSVAGTNRHNMSGVLGSYEARTSLTVGGQAATTDTWIQAGVLGRVGGALITIDTNGVLAGVAAMSNVATALAANAGIFAGFYVGKWASTETWSHGIYIQALAVDKAIQVGELSSTTVGSGVSLTNSVTRVMEVHADDNNTARTAGIQGRAILGRTMIYANTTQENWGIDGLVKWSTVAHTANVNAGVVGRFEAIGTNSTATGSGNTFVAGVMGRIGIASNAFTIGTGTWAVGVLAFYNTSTTNNPATGYTSAFMATASDIAGTGDWDYGLYVEDTTTGIYLTGCTTAIQTGVSGTAGGNILFYGDLANMYVKYDSDINRLTIQKTWAAASGIEAYDYAQYIGLAYNDDIPTGKYIAGLKIAMEGSGDYDSGASIYPLWIDFQNIGTNNTALCSHILLQAQSSACLPNSYFYFHVASPGVPYLFKAQAALAPGESAGDSPGHTGASVALKIKWGGTDYYLLASPGWA